MTPRHLVLTCAAAFAFAACSQEAAQSVDVGSTPEAAAASPGGHGGHKAPARFLTRAEIETPVGADASGKVAVDDDGRPLAYALLGDKAPSFTLSTSDGASLTQADLEGVWSVLDFWGMWCSDCLADARYASALRTALESDPAVQFVSIHTPPSPARAEEAFGKWGSLEAYFAEKGDAYPVAIDADASVREAFNIAWTPTYLLVAPDLTIHAFRTDLSVDDEDGIKPVVRQIAELRAAYAPVEGQADKDDLAGDAPALGRVMEVPPGKITPDGVAGLIDPTPFTLASAQRAFEGYEVRASERMAEGLAYPVLEVFKDGELALELWPDASQSWIASANALSSALSGPLGETPGETLMGDLPADELGECLPGVDDYADSLICWVSGETRFGRVFRAPESYSGPMDAISGEAREESQLVAILFRPEVPGEN